jgi:hypothetical protein
MKARRSGLAFICRPMRAEGIVEPHKSPSLRQCTAAARGAEPRANEIPTHI